MRCSKQVSSARLLIVTVAAAFAALQCGNDDDRSEGKGAGDRVSAPFTYSGFSSPEYGGYTKTTQYVSVSDRTKLAVDVTPSL